uniref:E3 ubiquitin-protein ligase n=1 Tax=Marseillevirus LCMAC103 TaxID=2506604 RepID=A0A481YUX1_9VIRU|nr:MAG: E3 ubiquitin-protein ligase [Marseillevirus LCMAC103]
MNTDWAPLNATKTCQPAASLACPVCVDPIPKGETVTCLACGYATDKKCPKRYLLSRDEGAHCMSCRARWGDKFLIAAFGKTWATGTQPDAYRPHLKKIFLDREKSRIPETLAELPRIRARNQAVADARQRLADLLVQQNILTRDIAQTRNFIAASGRRGGDQARPLCTFVCPCPKEECRGMIVAKTHACGICERRVCRRCRAPRVDDEKHECVDGDLETVRLLRTDTKPCPKCAVPIHRISGCSQMWCVQCHTSYNWRTGVISRGVTHNPHAMRWLREHGGNGPEGMRDVPCGGLVQMHHLGIWREGDDRGRYRTTIRSIYRRVAEIAERLNRIRLQPFDDLRIMFLLGAFSEAEWQQKIFLRERSNARRQATVDILTTFQTIAVERFRNLYETLRSPPPERMSIFVAPKKQKKILANFVKEMEDVRKFINSTFFDELRVLGTAEPLHITDKWTWSR